MNTPNVTRRKFLRQAAFAGAVAATAGTTAIATRRFARQRETAAALEKNPFAYNVRSETIDDRLVAYREAARFKVPRADTRRIASASGDRIYVAAGNYVSVFDDSGAALSDIALPSPARCVAAAGDGLLYVGLRDRLEIFNAKGQRQSTWEPAAPRSWFTGLAVGENDLFVADAGTRAILRYDRSGKLLKRIGEKESGKNVPGFVIPSPYFDVKLAADGLIRVTNPGRHQVEAYTRDGDFEFAWGKTTTAVEGFCGCCNPIGIALLPDGRCVTCEKGLPRVKVYSGRGEFESVVAASEMFTSESRSIDDESAPAVDVAIDSRGRVLVLDLARNEVRIMEPKVSV